MRQAAYSAIADALHQRDMAARNQSRQKVRQIAGDLAAVFAHEDPAFIIPDFYRACGFDGDDIALIEGQRREVDMAALARRSATDPGEDTTHQGWHNYETFVVGEWITNDQEIEAEALAVAEDAGTGEEYPDVRAAEALREWIESEKLAEDRQAEVWDVLDGPAGSLLNSALGEVDWLEIARHVLGIDAIS